MGCLCAFCEEDMEELRGWGLASAWGDGMRGLGGSLVMVFCVRMLRSRPDSVGGEKVTVSL